MSGFTPLFAKLVDSSIWSESLEVCKVFVTMLAKQDRNHCVMGDSWNLSQWAKMEQKDVIKALEVLSSPDTKRIDPQPFDGRRIKEIPGGWVLLNGEKYQRLMTSIFQRARNAENMRNRRAEMRIKSGGTLAERNAVAEANQDGGEV